MGKALFLKEGRSEDERGCTLGQVKGMKYSETGFFYWYRACFHDRGLPIKRYITQGNTIKSQSDRKPEAPSHATFCQTSFFESYSSVGKVGSNCKANLESSVQLKFASLFICLFIHSFTCTFIYSFCHFFIIQYLSVGRFINNSQPQGKNKNNGKDACKDINKRKTF